MNSRLKILDIDNPAYYSFALRSPQEILENPIYYLFDSQEPPPPGRFQYCGPHFLAIISYALKLPHGNNLGTFMDGLTSLKKAAYRLPSVDRAAYCFGCFPETTEAQNFLNSMVSFLIRTKRRKFFVVPKVHQWRKKVDIIETFIDFLVDAFQRLSGCTFSWIIIPGQIGILSQRLALLTAILQDIPFRCTEMEGRESILAEIESIANKVGIFLYSFFFTTDRVTTATMDLKLSLLLSKLEVVEDKMKAQCVTFFEQQKFATLNLTSSSLFIVDSLLDDLNHILNHKANLTVQLKDQITTLHEELYLSRSMLRDIELQQNKDFAECEMQLIDLAYQAEPFIACLVARQVLLYLAIRLPSFIQKSKLIRANLANIKLNSTTRCIQVAESSNEVSSSQVTTNIPMVDESMVGFKEITRQIASQLIGEPDRLQIISIIGMGGLGKTTLARKLYNDPNVRRHFDRRCWCVVSRTYKTTKLLIDILSCMPNQNKDAISLMEDHKLAERIYKSLKGTRYLLVVDDIWEKQVWHDLKRYFPDDENGSRILFTTRNKDVALDSVVNELPLLTHDQCWDLLHMKVFPNSLCPPSLRDVGKKIANSCKGLPLRVIGIASILANMEKKDGLWKEVATSISSYISKDDILELSYKHLPSHLKPCFLYLGMFKEDEEIRVKELLSLWTSQGFIPIVEDKSQEDVAHNYLLELINRSMVQVAKTRSNKGVKTCTIHDLILEMCLRVAEKENFFKVINDTFKDYEYSTYYGSILSGRYGNWGLRNFPNPLITSSSIRLKILKLSAGFRAEKLYDGIALQYLVQLRHLECDGKLINFSRHMKLEFLSLVELLDIHTELDMPKLRHLHFREYQRIPEAWDNSLSNSLQTLSGIIISDLDDDIRLRRFSHLRRLRCQYGKNWPHCPDCPDLRSLSQLVSLNVAGPFEFFNFPINIKKLSVKRVHVTPKVLSSIGTLPNLEILKIKRLRLTEMRWDMRDDLFMKLKFLKLHDAAFDKWNISEDHFPSLEHLVLAWGHHMCPLPSELGYIPTLQRIEVFKCNESVESSAGKIMEEQEAYGNEKLEVIITSYNF